MARDAELLQQGYEAVLSWGYEAAGAPSLPVPSHVCKGLCVVGRIQIMPNGSLVIYDVTTEDSGKYTCIAGNSCNIKHREAFLYVVGEGGAPCWDVASCHRRPHCFPQHILEEGLGNPFVP